MTENWKTAVYSRIGFGGTDSRKESVRGDAAAKQSQQAETGRRVLLYLY